MNAFYRLMLLTHIQQRSDYMEFILHCIHAGITCVQLREKHCSDDALYRFAVELKACLAPYRVPLIINDNVSLARAVDAAGVHLGQSDSDVIQAREQLGPNKIIGLSINTPSQLEHANTLPVDYVGVGAVFPTLSKPDVTTIWGIDGLRQACGLSQHPVVAIGGIDRNNAHEVVRAGAQGIAAIGAFHQASHPEESIYLMRNAFRQGE